LPPPCDNDKSDIDESDNDKNNKILILLIKFINKNIFVHEVHFCLHPETMLTMIRKIIIGK
jgi:hypothetical protein